MFLVPGEVELPVGGSLFGREAPLLFEVGFGNGWFLEHLGSRHPDFNVLGAETSTSSVHRAYRRLLKAGLENVRMFHGDAVFASRYLLAPNSLAGVYVNFPDPWPRRKHRAKRLLSSAYFELLHSRLGKDGFVALTTDHEGYFQYARGEAATSGLFDEEVAEPPEPMLATRYARKWLGQEKTIYHAQFHCRRSGSGDPASPVEYADFASPSVNDMQHALLTGSLDQVGVMPHTVEKIGRAHVVIMEHLNPRGESVHVFAGHIEEDGLKQDILIEALPRDNGIYVGVRRFGSPLATRGVAAAVHVVVEWLTTQGLELQQRWYRY